MRRHHVARQLGVQGVAQRGLVQRGTGLRHQEGDQPVQPVVVAQNNRGLAHPGQIGQLRLDLAQLQPEAADLHLVVDAAMEEQIAVRIDAHRVAGAVEHRIIAVDGEGVPDELLGGQFGTPQIALGHARPADQQFPLNAGGNERHRLVDHIATVIRDRAADGDGLVGTHFSDRRDDRGFGRAIAVEDRPRRTAPARRNGGRTGLAAQDDDAQARHVLGQHGQQRRHCVQHRDASLVQHIGQPVRLVQHLPARHPERRADQVGNEDFLQREVEGHRRALERHILAGDPIHAVGGAQVMADVGVADDDALGLAGGARGVDRICRMIAGDSSRAQIGRALVVGRQFLQPKHRHIQLRRLGTGDGVHQDGGGGTIGEADRHAPGGRIGVERQIGGSSLQYAEQRHMQVERPRHPQPDETPRSATARAQRVGDTVRPRFQFAVAH